MLSDVSEISDLSGDECLPPIPKSSTSRKRTATGDAPRTGKSGAEIPFQLKNSLRPPRSSTYSAHSLYTQITSGLINLDPEYQRGVVWNETKQTGLIDSMLGNYFIPPIIFAVSVDQQRNELRTCIDGKQRLTSIKRFMDGLIPYKDSHTNMKLWYKNTENHIGRLLPPHIKQQFDTKQVMCVEYDGLAEDTEREIFKRVQLGMALTAAERMQAIMGPWPDLIREFTRKYFPSSSTVALKANSIPIRRSEDLAQLMEWSATRGRDFHLIANIMYYLEKNITKMSDVPTYPSVPTLTRWLERRSEPSEELVKKLHEVLKIFVLFARNKGLADIFSRPQQISPAEFIMASVLISRKMGECSLDMLFNAITKMKADVRIQFGDIRTNQKTMKHMFEFLFKRFPKRGQLIPRARNMGNGGDQMRDDRPAVIIARSFDVGIPPTSSNGRKRKRNEDDTMSTETSNPGEDEKPQDSDNEDPNSVPVTSTPRRRGRPPKVANAEVRNPITKSASRNGAMSSALNIRAAKQNHFLMKDLGTPTSSTLASAVQRSTILTKNPNESPSSIQELAVNKLKPNPASRGSRTQEPIDLSVETDTEEVPISQIPSSSKRNHIVQITSKSSVSPNQEGGSIVTKEKAFDDSNGQKNAEADKSESESEDIRMVDSTLLQPTDFGATVASISSAETTTSTAGVRSLAYTNLTNLQHELSQIESQVINQALTSTAQSWGASDSPIPSASQLQKAADLADLKARVDFLQRSLQTLHPHQYSFQPVDGTIDPKNLLNTQPTSTDSMAKSANTSATSSLVQMQSAPPTDDALQIPEVHTSVPNSNTIADRPSHLPPRPINASTAVPHQSSQAVHWDRRSLRSDSVRRVQSKAGQEGFNRGRRSTSSTILTRDNGWKGFNERKSKITR